MSRIRVHKAAFITCLLVFAALVALPILTATTQAQGTGAGDCAACHKENVLPASHPPTTGMKLADCEKCHAPGSQMALAGKLTPAHRHYLAGVGCVTCHGEAEPKMPVSLEKCVTCHATADLIQKTAAVEPENPHQSPHWGTEMECSACHLQHRPTQNYCGYCHKMDFQVP